MALNIALEQGVYRRFPRKRYMQITASRRHSLSGYAVSSNLALIGVKINKLKKANN